MNFRRSTSDKIHDRFGVHIERLVAQRLARYGKERQRDVVQDVWMDVLDEIRRGVSVDRARVVTLVERNVKRCKRQTIRAGRVLPLEQGSGGLSVGARGKAAGREPEGLDGHQRPDELFEIRRNAQAVSDVLRETLSPTQYQVLQWRLGMGESVPSTALRLSVSPHVVKNELCRGLGRARAAMNGAFFGTTDDATAMWCSVDLVMAGLRPVSPRPDGCPPA